MRFIYGANQIIINSRAQYPYAQSFDVIQAKEKSASGVIHVESYPVKSGKLTMKYTDLTHEDYELMLNWFIDTVNGMAREFTIIDDLEDQYTVRFFTSNINFSQTSFGYWAGSLVFEVI